MIDADGCITMRRRKDGTCRSPVIAVDNTDREIIDELVRLFGGSVKAKTRYKEHHRQAWTWKIVGTNDILLILKAIHPYMRSRFKSERSKMLLESYKKLTPRHGRYTVDQKKAKDEFTNAFMNLGKGRGSRSYSVMEGAATMGGKRP